MRYDSSVGEIGPSQRPVPDNTQHSQVADFHASSGIRIRTPSNEEAIDPRYLRPLGTGIAY
jgi:hypothetical protein